MGRAGHLRAMNMSDLPPLPEVEEINDQPINQWHAQLLAQADETPKSSKFWNDQKSIHTRRECVVYDWPEGET